jgi:hypothetical protein
MLEILRFKVRRIPNSDDTPIRETFDGKPRYVTHGVAEAVGLELPAILMDLLRQEAKEKGGVDYLQQFELIDEKGTVTKIWIIDDGTVVTALLPDEY